jgi:hypothetical protein
MGFSNVLDKMIDDRLKSEGRKRKYDEIRSTTVTKEQQIQQLEKMLGVTSGKLASNNIFCLDANVRNLMLKDEEKKKKKASEIQQRKVVQQDKRQHTFRNAAIKYFGNVSLNVNDIKSLLQHVAIKGDSPVKSKVVELREQLQRRRQRLEMYNMNFPNVGAIAATNNIETTQNRNNNNNSDIIIQTVPNNIDAPNSTISINRIDSTNNGNIDDAGITDAVIAPSNIILLQQ